MHSQDTFHSSTNNQLDFSSAFLRATSAEQIPAIQMFGDAADKSELSETFSPQRTRENRNLSSILSHIRDDGSTRPQLKKTVAKNKKIRPARTAAADDVATVMSPAVQVRPLKQHKQACSNPYERAAGDDMKAFQNSDESMQPVQKPRQWLPLVLSLAVAVTAVTGFNLYRLNEQTNQMQAALNAYEEQVDELSLTQDESAGALLTVSGLSEELTGLKQQLQDLKSALADSNSKPVQNKVNVPQPKPQQQVQTKTQPPHDEQSLSQAQEAAILNPEQDKQVNKVVAAGIETTAIKPVENKRKETERVQQDTVKSTTWVVNLASLSSKEQVQIGVSMLEKSGMVPVVEKAEVNGATVYRLSVEGFSSRKEARQFISKAKKQYGFDGGWLRAG